MILCLLDTCLRTTSQIIVELWSLIIRQTTLNTHLICYCNINNCKLLNWTHIHFSQITAWSVITTEPLPTKQTLEPVNVFTGLYREKIDSRVFVYWVDFDKLWIMCQIASIKPSYDYDKVLIGKYDNPYDDRGCLCCEFSHYHSSFVGSSKV